MEKIRDQNTVLTTLSSQGISFFACPYTPETLKRWNALLDPLFKAQGDIFRSYVSTAKLFELGIVDEFFNTSMRSLIRSAIPDAVLATLDCYESQGGQSEGEVYDSNSEWHLDIQSMPGLDPLAFNYLSIFINLSDVNEDSGAFEIRPLSPKILFRDGDVTMKATGNIGTSYIWNRSFYHRASMNRSKIRRRILKISIQHNYLENSVVILPEFRQTLEKIDKEDLFLRFLFGEKYQNTHLGPSLPEVPVTATQVSGGGSDAAVRASNVWKLYRRVRTFTKRRIAKIIKK